MHHTYTIIPSLKLVLQLLTKEITLKEMITAKNTVLNDPDFNADYNFIVDVTMANYNFSNSDRTLFSHYIKDLIENGIQIRTALLTLTPNQVVNASLIYQNTGGLKNINYQFLSQLKTAVSFFKYSRNDFKTIHKAFTQLKETANCKNTPRSNSFINRTDHNGYYRHKIIPKAKLIVQCHINHVDLLNSSHKRNF